jgi:siroheme decarboxylase
MDQVEHHFLNDYQRDFPLEPRPYARIADELGLPEEEVLARLADLQAGGTLSRIGAVVRPNTVGASTLAAMSVPAGRLEAVAALVSARPEVNHNYEREHAFNLWFVVAAADEAAVRAVLESIAAETGLPVLDLPLQTAYHIDLGFDLPCP